MKIGTFARLALAIGAMILHGSSAQAEFVTYTALGSFSAGSTPGTSTYSAPGISIAFESPLNNSVNVPPTSQVSFGQFNTILTTAPNFVGLLGNFTLNIFQSAPTFGSLTFVGALSGQLRVDNSQAFVQFNPPPAGLVGTIGSIFYRIASADDNVLGRVNIAPPTTNNGRTTIVGQIGIVPEPGSFVLLAMGCPIVVGFAYRSRRKLQAAA